MQHITTYNVLTNRTMKTQTNWHREGEIKYLVVWTHCATRQGCWDADAATDQYHAFESLDGANAKMAQLREDEDIYSYSLCAVIESSDYPQHPALSEEVAL